MPDGTLYAGISPDSGKPLYAAPVDASRIVTFAQAKQHASSLDLCGHRDWRLPTRAELDMLFTNRDTLAGFNTSGSSSSSWYWSAAQDGAWGAWCQSFSDGKQDCGSQEFLSSVRYVR